MPAIRWSSHKDIAAKALKKLAGPHVPTSLSKLEQAVKRAHAAYDKAETTAREQQRDRIEQAARALLTTDGCPEVSSLIGAELALSGADPAAGRTVIDTVRVVN